MTSEHTKTVEQRIKAIIDLCMKLAAGDYNTREAVSERDDHLDAIVTGVNMLAEELESSVMELTHKSVFIETHNRYFMRVSALFL